MRGVTIRDKMSVRTMLVLVLPTLGFSTGALAGHHLPAGHPRPVHAVGTLIGLAIGGEGIFSALIPLWVGVISDRIWTKRWGRRQPFMIFAGPFMAAALILAPFQPGYVPIAISTFVFFAAYHFYTSPYQSLIADVTPGQQRRARCRVTRPSCAAAACSWEWSWPGSFSIAGSRLPFVL